MDPQAADVPVFVIAGSWECSENGIWDFYIAKECYARSISMNRDMTFEELLLTVRTEFELDGLGLKPKLSYWLPSQLSVFAVNSRPPVIITSNMSLRNFLNVKETAEHLNLLLSLEPESADAGSSRLREHCSVPAAKAKDIGGDDTGAAYAAMVPTNAEMPQRQNIGTNSGSRVRKRLFGDNDASCCNEAIRLVSVDTSDTSMIRLADPDTPSLTAQSEDSNAAGAADVQHISSDDDDDFLTEIDAAEKREKDLRICKGKGKCEDSGDDMLKSKNDDCFTDGVVWSGSDDDLCDEDYWTLAFDRQYEFDYSQALLLSAEVEADAIAPSVEAPVLAPGEEDIGTTVLAYIETERGNREAAEDNLFGNDSSALYANQEGGYDSPRMGQLQVYGSPEVGVVQEGGVTDSPTFSVGNEGRGESFPRLSLGNQTRGESSSLFDVAQEGVTFDELHGDYTQRRDAEPGLSLANQRRGESASVYDVAQEGVTFDELDGDYTQRRDAEPVIDDVYSLTNTDGCATVSAEEDAIYIGRVFKDKVAFQNTLAIYAIKRLFHFRQTKSDPLRVICVCIDKRCPWRVFAHRVSEFSENFAVRTATLTHTCSIIARSQYEKQASARVIAEVLKGKYANGLPGPRAVDIPDIVLAELKVSVTYMKAWYAKEAAIIQSRGSDEKSYKLLAVYMYLLQKGNPGTIYRLEYTGGGLVPKQFKYLFFALGASIAGIKHMRKVVLVDGTAIKAKFKGVLIAASMQDANFQVYPIAFAIVDAENDLAWTWFFTKLSQLIPDAEDVVLVSDRHRSIYAAVRKVYPLAFHGACAVHIERNVRAKNPGTGLSYLVGNAARAFNVGDFKELYAEIVKQSKKCAAYLDAIPLEHWTQAYCPAKRYNIMSSNIAEALNGALAKIVELPIVSMVESIRTKLMEWFCFRREKAKKLIALGETITPKVNEFLLRHHKDSAGLPVKAVSEWSFQVTSGLKKYYVDLALKTCTCLQFQKLELPCCHALAAARTKGVEVTMLIGSHYRVSVFRDAYEMFIFPVPNESDVDIPVDVQETEFMPPENKNGPGRRRKRRIPSTGEYTGTKRRKHGPHKCSTCNETGHNRATCSNIPR